MYQTVVPKESIGSTTKIAICFSGHPRTFEKCFDSIKSNLIDKYDCDIFISTWFISNEISNKIKNLYNPKLMNILNYEEYTSKFNHYINSLPSVNTSQFEKVSETTDSIISYESGNYFSKDVIINQKKNPFGINVISQFFGIYDSAQLCLKHSLENKIKYDYIFRMRLDNKIFNNFKFYEINENEIIVNQIQNYNNNIKVQDHFFLARHDIFFKIANLYIDLSKVIEYTNKNNYFIPSHGVQETILFINIIRQNIKIKCSEGRICKLI